MRANEEIFIYKGTRSGDYRLFRVPNNKYPSNNRNIQLWSIQVDCSGRLVILNVKQYHVINLLDFGCYHRASGHSTFRKGICNNLLFIYLLLINIWSKAT